MNSERRVSHPSYQTDRLRNRKRWGESRYSSSKARLPALAESAGSVGLAVWVVLVLGELGLEAGRAGRPCSLRLYCT